jgi:hypothetical protein
MGILLDVVEPSLRPNQKVQTYHSIPGFLQYGTEVAPPQDHLVCCAVEGRVKFIIRSGLKPSQLLFIPCAPHCHLTEQEAQDAFQLLGVGCVDDALLKVVEGEWHCS